MRVIFFSCSHAQRLILVRKLCFTLQASFSVSPTDQLLAGSAVKANQCAACGFAHCLRVSDPTVSERPSSFTTVVRRYPLCECTNRNIFSAITHESVYYRPFVTPRRCVGSTFRSVCMRWRAVTTPTHPLLLMEKRGEQMSDLSGF